MISNIVFFAVDTLHVSWLDSLLEGFDCNCTLLGRIGSIGALILTNEDVDDITTRLRRNGKFVFENKGDDIEYCFLGNLCFWLFFVI